MLLVRQQAEIGDGEVGIMFLGDDEEPVVRRAYHNDDKKELILLCGDDSRRPEVVRPHNVRIVGRITAALNIL